MPDERAIAFDCEGERLLGILHQPLKPFGDIGVVLVVGGPQYRVGSHRQFVLLARALADAGIPVLRFDFRGMGDSTGVFREFEAIERDIAAAVDVMLSEVAGIDRVVLWGLCDAATANAFYALSDTRVIGQVAANPWVRTVEGEAQAFIRHYYLQRFLSRDLWRKVFRLKFNPIDAASDLFGKLVQSRTKSVGADTSTDTAAKIDNRPLPQRLFDAQTRCDGKTLLILSGQDLTAREYQDRVEETPPWRDWLSSQQVSVHHLEAADHTFSTRAWGDQVSSLTRDWIIAL
jgi:exosortase A-associated hydrolase 1